MPVKRSCCGDGGAIVTLACSGRSNVGQLTNDTAVELDRLGGAHFLCLAAIGAGDEEVAGAARKADRVVVLDGCDKVCGRKIMEAAGFRDFPCLDVTTLGIEKHMNPHFTADQLERVKAAAIQLARPANTKEIQA